MRKLVDSLSRALPSPKLKVTVESEKTAVLKSSKLDLTAILSSQLLLRIFSKLPDSQCNSNLLVCKRWLNLHGRLVYSVKLLNWDFLISGRLLSRLPNLTDVDLVATYGSFLRAFQLVRRRNQSLGLGRRNERSRSQRRGRWIRRLPTSAVVGFKLCNVQKQTSVDQFQVLVRHWQPVTIIALSSNDLRRFSSSKDGTIVHWDVDSGKSEKYAWPSKETLS
ncbi:hypothetical protein NE237_002571 [Protea cynaroides]|uniref:F-box domain-containing protein n=1 Tax=Protea cynaroides TaxID=273540 RepID=A0A9Q0KVF4_9MAGN|nr:hypothetical protein NE237_002571 [Protea cynaroides]